VERCWFDSSWDLDAFSGAPVPSHWFDSNLLAIHLSKVNVRLKWQNQELSVEQLVGKRAEAWQGILITIKERPIRLGVKIATLT
jgi:hypothetical protein